MVAGRRFRGPSEKTPPVMPAGVRMPPPSIPLPDGSRQQLTVVPNPAASQPSALVKYIPLTDGSAHQITPSNGQAVPSSDKQRRTETGAVSCIFPESPELRFELSRWSGREMLKMKGFSNEMHTLVYRGIDGSGNHYFELSTSVHDITHESSIIRFVLSDSNSSCTQSTLGGALTLNLLFHNGMITLRSSWSESLVAQWRKRQEKANPPSDGKEKFRLELPYTFVAPHNQCITLSSKELRPDRNVFIGTGNNGDKFNLYYLNGTRFQAWIQTEALAIHNKQFQVPPDQQYSLELPGSSDSLSVTMVYLPEGGLRITACWTKV